MFEQVVIRASSREASERFYETLLDVLGLAPTRREQEAVEWRDLRLVGAAGDDEVTRGLHVGLSARSRDAVDEFWRAGVAAGYRDDGRPGPRPQYREDYYGAFLLDPDGNSVEAVHHGAMRRGGAIDHLWIRVADIAAARRSYDAVAPGAGIRVVYERPDQVRFSNGNGSLTLVAGTPTENADVTFL